MYETRYKLENYHLSLHKLNTQQNLLLNKASK